MARSDSTGPAPGLHPGRHHRAATTRNGPPAHGSRVRIRARPGRDDHCPLEKSVEVLLGLVTIHGHFETRSEPGW